MSAGGGWPRLYRALLRLLPPRLREGSGEELGEVFDRVLEDARGAGGARARHARAARECWDVLALAARSSTSRCGVGIARSLDDLRVAGRSLGRRPGFALVATGTLAVGVGAATAIFALTDSLLLRPLPYPDGDRLVMVWRVVERYDMRRAPFSLPDVHDLLRDGEVFESWAAFTGARATLQGSGDAVRLDGWSVTGDLFGTLRVPVAMGRPLTPADDRPGAEPVVVVSHALWTSRFGADPAAVGRRVTLDGAPARVVGVAPPGFRFPRPDADFWRPLARDAVAAERDFNYLVPVARLAPGVDPERASERLEAFVAALAAEHPGANETDGAWLEPRKAFEVGDAAGAVAMLAASVALLLLLACANLAGLLATRASGRRSELAVRSALGAGTRGIARTLVAEAVAVAAAGSVAGSGLAALLLAALERAAPPELLARGAPVLDGRVLAFCLACALLSAVLCALFPVRRAARAGPAAALRATGGAGRRPWGRDGLVVAQVALATVLLVGAGLLGTTLARILDEPMGFDAARLLTAEVPLPSGRYPDAAVAAFHDRLLERLEGAPGVERAAASWAPPLVGSFAGTAYLPEGAAAGAEPISVSLVPVRGAYLETLGVPLLEGRAFGPGDDGDAPPVALASQALARAFFPGGRAVGRRLVKDGEEGPTIVGVVGDVRRDGPAAEPELDLYVPHAQAPWARNLVVVVRAERGADPLALASAVRGAVRQLDASLPVTNLTTLERALAASAAEPRSRALLLGVFATAAGLIAALGVYGVLAYRVAERRRDVALRVALGAPRAAVMRSVLAWAAGLGSAGLALGLAGASLTAPALRAFLFQVSPLEPAVYLGVAALVAASVAAAGWLPARRAARVDPMATLRAE